MANTKISALTALTNPTGSEEFVYAYNNANGKVTLNTMKSFIGGGGGSITTLNADANIWELAEGFYETTYALYYKTGEAVENYNDHKTLLFVVEESGNKAYFTFCAYHSDISDAAYAGFGYSASSSDGEYRSLDRWDKSLRRFGYLVGAVGQTAIDSLSQYSITQVIPEINGDATNNLRISSSNPPYEGMTYTIYIEGVQSGETYDITLGTGVTNPFGITLPTNCNKKSLITVLITSSTTGIVTSCTIES